LGVARLSSETILQLTQPHVELQLIDPEIDLEEEEEGGGGFNIASASAGRLLVEFHILDDEEEDGEGDDEDGDGAGLKIENQVVLKNGNMSKDMEVELSVVGCSDLAKVDSRGKPDVYCEVRKR
jgi:hypothetical protein